MLTTVLGRDRDSLVVDRDPETREGILHSPAAAADRHARRFHVARFRAVLRVLGSDAGADVFPDRRVGQRAAAVRGDQVFPVYAGRIGADAAGDPGDLFQARNTFDIRDDSGRRRTRCSRCDLQHWLFWGFFFAFAIKVPMFPFHTWLPDAHTEAPTAGSVILAGVLLKMGTYGFLRFSVPMFPDATLQVPLHHDRALADRNYLRRAGLHDAEGHEKADRLFVGQPHGILHAGNFCADAAGAFRQHHSADQSRNFHRRALLDCRRALRAAAYAVDFGIWRTCPRRCRISRRCI